MKKGKDQPSRLTGNTYAGPHYHGQQDFTQVGTGSREH